MKQKLTEIIDKNISKSIGDMNSTINHLDITDIYRTYAPTLLNMHSFQVYKVLSPI